MMNHKTEGAIRGLRELKAAFAMTGTNATTIERAIRRLEELDLQLDTVRGELNDELDRR